MSFVVFVFVGVGVLFVDVHGEGWGFQRRLGDEAEQELPHFKRGDH